MLVSTRVQIFYFVLDYADGLTYQLTYHDAIVGSHVSIILYVSEIDFESKLIDNTEIGHGG